MTTAVTPHNNLVNLAHQKIAARLSNGSIAIDATIGNGHDTLWLAQHLAPQGLVYGFDIQAAALTATRHRLQNADLLKNIRLIQANHAELIQHIPLEHHGHIAACMFNLGYLPGADKNIVTQTDSTISALNAVLAILSPAGLISILAYPGHSGGDIETQAVNDWSAQLDRNEFTVSEYLSTYQKPSAPKLLIIEKKSA